MSILTNHILMAAAGARGGALSVADVFSTDLWTGVGGNVTISNGINLSAEGGLVWIKSRSSSGGHVLSVNALGSGFLSSEGTGPYNTYAAFPSFNNDGFASSISSSGTNYAAWTFRKSPRFFDVVTYTGDGTNFRTVSHNLGTKPGMVIIKRRDASGVWQVWARLASGQYAQGVNFNLNSTAASNLTSSSNTHSDTAFETYISNNEYNTSSGTYVAYLFAHDPSPDGIIQCGSYTGNGSNTGPIIDLGWEPQWLLVKNAQRSSTDWALFDAARSGTNPRNKLIKPNLATSESSGSAFNVDFTSAGFQIKTNLTDILNINGENFIYMAIRAEGV